MELLYEGKAKKIFSTDHPDEFLMVFKDDATAFNGEKLAQFANKGRINKELTLLLYRQLEADGVPTHFIRDVDDTSLLVKRVEIIAIEYVVRNIVAGSLAKRSGQPEGHILSQPLIEFYYKDDALGDPMINLEHIREMQLATVDELAEMRRQALQVNTTLQDLFGKAGIKLVDFKLEFGRVLPGKTEIVLADEISPDTCRLWDAETNEKMDKDRFRRDLGDMMSYYAEVLQRLKAVSTAS
jgi:phosphoribosylaminoimidazole-succinocarboxamide synthase